MSLFGITFPIGTNVVIYEGLVPEGRPNTFCSPSALYMSNKATLVY